MLQQSKAVKCFFALSIVWLALAFNGHATYAAPPKPKVIKPSAYEATHFINGLLELEVPPGAVNQELTVLELNVDLDGIQIPNGVKIVSKMIRFGPHGVIFPKGKELKFKMKLEDAMEGAKLYYINRVAKSLEAIETQKINSTNRMVEANLEHFSDYVVGITSGWDGSGIYPFTDYVKNGEEFVSLYELNLSIHSKVFSLPGRGGMDLTLARTNANNIYLNIPSTLHPLAINRRWSWSLLYYNSNNNKLYFPDGTSYDVPTLSPGSPEFKGVFPIVATRDYGNVKFRVEQPQSGSPIIYLKNGTKIYNDAAGDQLIADVNGNQIRYTFTTYDIFWHSGQNVRPCYAKLISSIVDSVGRTINFQYKPITGGTIPTLMSVKLGDKVVMSLTGDDSNDIFTDAVGRTIKYTYGDVRFGLKGGFSEEKIIKINYPNGVYSEYAYQRADPVYKSYPIICVQSQTFVSPNRKSRKTSYTINDGLTMSDITRTIDGGRITHYKLTHESYKSNQWCYILNETTQDLSGKIYQSITNDYYKDSYLKLHTQSIQYAKADGTLGPAATTEYAYDDWGNITMIKDPNGTATYMAYSNTNSNPNLSSINPLYQNYEFKFDKLPTNRYDLLLTKATLVTDSVHNITQLKQTSYKYDLQGNLLRESQLYKGNTYLGTNYTYDQYGNMTSKTDANGNTLYFEYANTTALPYKSAYLTRVYRPDGRNLANYAYDFNTGNRTMVTDPNRNKFFYQYDAIGRLTREELPNSDSKIRVERQISYDDINNTVALRYGNSDVGYQDGLITFDRLCGKPNLIQRKVNGSWVTQKQFEYDTNGRLSWEQDGKGHRTYYTYDGLDRKTMVTLPNGSTTKYTYDNRTVTTIDPKGNKKSQTYDLLDRLVSLIESPDNGVTSYLTEYTYDSFYDILNEKPVYHLVKVVNPRKAVTSYSYDNLGRLTCTDTLKIIFPKWHRKPLPMTMLGI